MAFILNDNMFYTNLTNLALYISMYNTNKSNRTKNMIDSFTTESLAYGDTKVYRALPMPEVSDYSSTSSLLGNYTPSFTPKGESTPVNVKEDTLSINNFKIIKNTYNVQMLEMAVKNEFGASEFIAIVMNNIEGAKNNYLYNLLVDELYSANYTGTEEVELFDISTLTNPGNIIDAEKLNQERITLAVQKVIDSLTHYTDEYNAYGLTQAVDLSDLRLIMVQPWQNKGVVNLFAELLNSGIINEKMPRPEMVTIPETKAKAATGYDDKVIAILMHKEYIQMFYKLVFMGDFFDPSTLNVNNFLHFWFALGEVPQLPSCVIKVKGTEETEVTK